MTDRIKRKAMQAVEVALDDATMAYFKELARLCRTTPEMCMRVFVTHRFMEKRE